MKNILLYLTIFVSGIVYSQNATFKTMGGVNLVSSSDPYLVLSNTDYDNVSSTNIGGRWIFIGTNQQTISGNQTSFDKGTLNNSNGFIISTPVTFTNELNMITGVVANSSLIEVGYNSSNIGTLNWTDGTVTGQLKRWFNNTNSTQSSGIFPIGTSSYNRNIIINYTEATSGGYLIGEYVSGIPSITDPYNGLPLASSDNQTITDYVTDGYWNISPDSYSSSMNTKKFTVTIRANNLTNITDRNLTRIIKNSEPSNTVWITGGTHNSINGASDLDYTLVSDNVIGLNWLHVGLINNNPLPIELLYFGGSVYPSFNSLKWSTASEYNSDYFQIEKSIDGETWKSIGHLLASGNSTIKVNYSYLDSFDDFVIHYYRLKQFDYDGQFKIYGPISLDNTKAFKKVIYYINTIGQIVQPETRGLIFEVYEDGTMKKIIR